MEVEDNFGIVFDGAQPGDESMKTIGDVIDFVFGEMETATRTALPNPSASKQSQLR